MSEALAATRSSSATAANRSNWAPELPPDEVDPAVGGRNGGAASRGKSRRSVALADAWPGRCSRSCGRVARAAAGVRRRLAGTGVERVVADCPDVAFAVVVGPATTTRVGTPGDRPVGAGLSWARAARCSAGAACDRTGAGSGRTSSDGSGVGPSAAATVGTTASMHTRSATTRRNAGAHLAAAGADTSCVATVGITRFWQDERRTPDRRARLNRCQCGANVGLTVTRTPSQHATWTITVMAIRPGAAEASDARMTWPTTFRLLVREEDREPPLRSHREREILALAVTGLTNPQIAARLHVTQSTARTHLSWAFGRLGVRSRGEPCCCLHATRSSGGTCLPRWTDPPRRLARRTE